MSLLESLDRFVHSTRLDLLTPHGQRPPRNLRRLPLAGLIGLPLGYGLLVPGIAAGGSWRSAMVGSLIFFGSYLAANLIRLFGPRLMPQPGGELDERELMIRSRALSLSGSVLVWLLILGCFYGGYASVFGTWTPRTPLEWVYLGLGVQGWWLLLPVLIASWLQPEPDEES